MSNSLADKILKDVRPHERTRFYLFCSVYCLLTFAQTLGIAGSEALFLAKVGMGALPLTLMLAAILTVGSSVIYAYLVGGMRNDTLFCNMLILGSLLLFGLSPWLSSCHLTIYVAFCLYYITNAIFINHYWTWVGDYFDTLSAKRLFPLFAVGSSLGGFLGGVAGAYINSVWGPNALVVSWAIFMVITAVTIMISKKLTRSWGPLGLPNEEDSAWVSMVKSLRYLKTSPLTRWLSCSALAMVLALFIAQYLESGIFAASFPDAQDLATFMNRYLIATNLLEIVVEGIMAPWLIAHLGVAQTNLVHPLLTVLAFISLLINPGLSCAVGSRINREVLENSLAGPVRSLVYNGLPERLRGHVRAFLEGIVVYSGMAVAGLILYAFAHHLNTFQWAIVGSCLAMIYLYSNIHVLRHYLRTLVSELRSGRIDIASVEGNLSTYEGSHLANIWETMLNEDQNRVSQSALQLTNTLARLNRTDSLLKHLHHSSNALRCAIVKALPLANDKDRSIRKALMSMLQDSDHATVAATLSSLCQVCPELKSDDDNQEVHTLRQVIVPLLDHPSYDVQAHAATLLGNEGQEILDEMTTSDKAERVMAALEVCDKEHIERLKRHLTDINITVRACAVQRLSELVQPIPMRFEDLLVLIKHRETRIRCIGFRALGTMNDLRALAYLASGLNSNQREVRLTVSNELAKHPSMDLQTIGAYLNADSSYAIEAAIVTISQLSTLEARHLLFRNLRLQVYMAWTSSLCLYTLTKMYGELIDKQGNPLPLARKAEERMSEADRQLLNPKCLPLLAVALFDNTKHSLRLAFKILANTANPTTIKLINRSLKHPENKEYDQALEILSNLEDRESTQLLVLLYEKAPIEDKFPSLPIRLQPPRDLNEVIITINRSGAHWLQLATHGSHSQESLMERLLILRRIPLFNSMTLEQLEAINKIVREAHYLKGEVVIREGDIGSELYLLVAGSVNVYKNYGTPQEILLTTLSGINYFGEMAILDDEPRSASIVINEDADLLCLDGDQLKDLINDIPEIAFEIFRVLTQRIRSSEARLKANAPPSK